MNVLQKTTSTAVNNFSLTTNFPLKTYNRLSRYTSLCRSERRAGKKKEKKSRENENEVRRYRKKTEN